eukprot:CAMPEP_0113961640 /NCGR_PEP_ID=MMETSP0011_2-20120614/5431_1 /TAXON_ID=101924 /ORGANISM="Rhodosorus marinus" /LENGTH=61 /DNA_ID=CAMNT_0000973323 /DNA_START=1252 /DNA_END=1434 /DNA_ORIENTATION=- /assembly_acc=CAM_ASM_000156
MYYRPRLPSGNGLMSLCKYPLAESLGLPEWSAAIRRGPVHADPTSSETMEDGKDENEINDS